MTNYFSEIWILFHLKTRLSKIYIVELAGLIILLILSVNLFSLCNTIPIKRIELDFQSMGPKRTDIDARIFLSANTDLYGIDSNYFDYSGRIGIYANVFTDTIHLSRPWIYINELKRLHSFEDYHDVDSLIHGVVRISAKTPRFDKLPFYVEKRNPGFLERYFLPPEDGFKTGNYCYVSRYRGAHYCTDTLTLLVGSAVSEYVRSNTNRPASMQIFNVLELSDISQAYFFLTIKRMQRNVESLTPYREASQYNQPNLKLYLDFGAPISTSHMMPEPDYADMKGIGFANQNKIKSIEKDGLAFHVEYLHNKNMQSMKMFFLTTLITAVITLMITVLTKLCKHQISGYRTYKHNKNI